MMEKVKEVLEERYEELGWLGLLLMILSITVIPENIGNLGAVAVPFAVGLILWAPSIVFWKKE